MTAGHCRSCARSTECVRALVIVSFQSDVRVPLQMPIVLVMASASSLVLLLSATAETATISFMDAYSSQSMRKNKLVH